MFELLNGLANAMQARDTIPARYVPLDQVDWDKLAPQWSRDHEARNKAVWIEMLRRTSAGWRTKMLDVGCGSGGATAIARGMRAEVVGVDSSETMIGCARERIPLGRFFVMFAEELMFPDNSFDLVFASDLLPWCDAPVAMAEMKRVTKKGGHIVTAEWQSGLPRRAIPAHRSSGSLMENAGLRVLESSTFDVTWQFDSAAAAEHAVTLLKGEDLPPEVLIQQNRPIKLRQTYAITIGRK